MRRKSWRGNDAIPLPLLNKLNEQRPPKSGLFRAGFASGMFLGFISILSAQTGPLGLRHESDLSEAEEAEHNC